MDSSFLWVFSCLKYPIYDRFAKVGHRKKNKLQEVIHSKQKIQ
jgi:hypothetical protein